MVLSLPVAFRDCDGIFNVLTRSFLDTNDEQLAPKNASSVYFYSKEDRLVKWF